jgi:hypothetical protein
MNAAGEITHAPPAFKRRIDVSPSMASINVRFAATAPLQIQIKHVMKTSAAIPHKPIPPSLFQIASRVEESAAPLNPTPFVGLRSHPEKLEAALKKTAKSDNDAFDAARCATSKTRDDHSVGKPSSHSLVELKTTEFHLEAPFAESVKLAADFTDWEKFPLDMIKSGDGVWFTTVPLPPGHYSYRFIVDGEWCDDPSSVLLLHDHPPGRAHAVMEVV